MEPVANQVESPGPAAGNPAGPVFVHIWSTCHHCLSAPIMGPLYHCSDCPAGPDNDLCRPCYEKYLKGEIPHPRPGTLGAAMNLKNHHFAEEQGKPLHLYENWLKVEPPPFPVVPFHVPARFIVRPVFCAGAEASIGGYAFVISLGKNRPILLLTALHVMDEIMKKKGINCSIHNPNYTGKELPAVITEVNIYDLLAANWMLAPLGSAGPMLVLPDARSDEEEPFSDLDIAAFLVNEKAVQSHSINPLPLAQHAPAVGEPVWLLVKLAEQAGPCALPAVVVEKTPRTMVFRFTSSDAAKQKYTSGAPLLDKHGEVVGINVGGGKLAGHKLGHANHVESIRRHLDK